MSLAKLPSKPNHSRLANLVAQQRARRALLAIVQPLVQRCALRWAQALARTWTAPFARTFFISIGFSLFLLIGTRVEAAEPMRVLNFPPDKNYGQINVLKKDWNPSKSGKGFTNESYIARGQIKIARDKNLSLVGSYALSEHLDVLQKLPPDSFARLDLGKLSIQSRDLANISHLTGLRQLDLDQTDIDDSALQYIKPLNNLRFLSISRTLLKGSTLGKLTALTKLERLHISHCDMDPANFCVLPKLKTLKFLHLGSDKVSDHTIDFLILLTKLEDLGLDGNNAITDSGVKKLACLTSLHFLNLADSKVTAGGVMALKGLPLLSIRLGCTRVTLASQTMLKKAFPGCSIEIDKSHETPIEVFAPLH
jgi:hypothetical protein